MRRFLQWTTSVQARLLVVVLCAVSPVFGVLLWSGAQLQQTAHAGVVEDASRALRSIEYQQTLVFQSARQLLQSLSLWPSIIERNVPRLNELLAAQFAVQGTYATISVADASGMVFASAHPPAQPFSIADRDYFRQAMDTGAFSVGSYVSSRTTGSPVIPFALPVFDEAGEIDSVVVASYLIDDYNNLISGDVVPSGWTAEIVDRFGFYVYRYPLRAATPLGTPVPAGLLAILRSGDRFHGNWSDTAGVEYYVVAAAFSAFSASGSDLYALVRAPVSAVFSSTRGVVTQLLILGLLSILFAVIVTIALGRRTIVNRLRSLGEVSDALACGDLTVRTGLSHNEGEIGRVAAAYDGMVEALQARESAHQIAEATISASLAEKEVLLKEIHHRVKNNFQIVSSLLRMQAAEADDSRVNAQFLEAENRIRSMAMIHEKLYQSDSTSEIDFHDYIGTVVRSIQQVYLQPDSAIDIDILAETVVLPLDQAVPLALIINELITNSYKHAFAPDQRGRISVRLERSNSWLRLEVSDNGSGSGPETSKGTLGMQLVHALADQLRGDIVLSRNGGTSCVCSFPEKTS